MSFSMYEVVIPSFTHMLKNLSIILDRGQHHATEHNIATEELLNARLNPDMFSLTRQVQMACDHAKFAAARLSGNEASRFADDETTFDQLKERIANTLNYMASIPESAYGEAVTRQIEVKIPSAVLNFSGKQYVMQWAIPNFYFHMTTAYDILRHQGVPLGKAIFLSGKTRS